MIYTIENVWWIIASIAEKSYLLAVYLLAPMPKGMLPRKATWIFWRAPLGQCSTLCSPKLPYTELEEVLQKTIVFITLIKSPNTYDRYFCPPRPLRKIAARKSK